MDDGTAYFTMVISYEGKIFMKSNTNNEWTLTYNKIINLITQIIENLQTATNLLDLRIIEEVSFIF